MSKCAKHRIQVRGDKTLIRTHAGLNEDLRNCAVANWKVTRSETFSWKMYEKQSEKHEALLNSSLEIKWEGIRVMIHWWPQLSSLSDDEWVQVGDRIREVDGLWSQLVEATARKGAKLKEAGDEQLFNRNIEEVESWISELEGQVSLLDSRERESENGRILRRISCERS